MLRVTFGLVCGLHQPAGLRRHHLTQRPPVFTVLGHTRLRGSHAQKLQPASSLRHRVSCFFQLSSYRRYETLLPPETNPITTFRLLLSTRAPHPIRREARRSRSSRSRTAGVSMTSHPVSGRSSSRRGPSLLFDWDDLLLPRSPSVEKPR